ncbi:hypothetical protein [Nakamurella sp.]|uniref:hypothetical protein n=1 Tax=Nakamurella sp. TaxID=1869182 RepID=UPI003783EAA3
MSTEYEIRVRGHLRPETVAAIGPMAAALEPAETVLHGSLRDQAELYGVLDRLQALGLDLVGIRSLAAPTEDGDAR